MRIISPKRLTLLPWRLVSASGLELNVPQFISRTESQGRRSWRVTPGKAGIFVDGARERSFSDRWDTASAWGSPKDSLGKAIDYLATIFKCLAARPTYRRRAGAHGYMLPGLTLKLRQPSYRAKTPGVWVIMVSMNDKSLVREKRQYVVVGEDGRVTQEQLVVAIREACVLRAGLLVARAKANAKAAKVRLNPVDAFRPAFEVLSSALPVG